MVAGFLAFWGCRLWSCRSGGDQFAVESLIRGGAHWCVGLFNPVERGNVSLGALILRLPAGICIGRGEGGHEGVAAVTLVVRVRFVREFQE